MALDIEDEDEETQPPKRRRPPPAPPFNIAKVMHVVRIAAWAMLFFAISCGGLLFCSALGKSSSAPQEAAVGAIFATVFIGLYILTRCIDQILESAERMRSK